MAKGIDSYVAVGISPTVRGVVKREQIKTNIDHIHEVCAAACWLSSLDLPVRLIVIPEGALQGFTDEVFDWEHQKYASELLLTSQDRRLTSSGRLPRNSIAIWSRPPKRMSQNSRGYSLTWSSFSLLKEKCFSSTARILRSFPSNIRCVRTMCGISGLRFMGVR